MWDVAWPGDWSGEDQRKKFPEERAEPETALPAGTDQLARTVTTTWGAQRRPRGPGVQAGVDVGTAGDATAPRQTAAHGGARTGSLVAGSRVRL